MPPTPRAPARAPSSPARPQASRPGGSPSRGGAPSKPKTPPKNRALGRKVGPLPVWAWSVLLLAVITYWIIRSRRTATGAIDPADLTGTQGATPLPADGGGGASSGSSPERLEPITLGPGEGVYDPNTGNLITNPDPYALLPQDGGGPTTSPTTPGGTGGATGGTGGGGGGLWWGGQRFTSFAKLWAWVIGHGYKGTQAQFLRRYPGVGALPGAPGVPPGGGGGVRPRINLKPPQAGASPVSIGSLLNLPLPSNNRKPGPDPPSTSRPTFNWGGRSWGRGDRDSFSSWLKQHGSNYSTWAKNHPAAAGML